MTSTPPIFSETRYIIADGNGNCSLTRARLLALPPKVASQDLGMESYVEVEGAALFYPLKGGGA